MITYISEANAALYNRRFSKAEDTLKAKDSSVYGDISIGSLEEYFAYLRDLATLTDAENPDLGRFFTMLPLDEDTFDIDANTRKISVPASSFGTNGVGVEGDEMAEVVYFTIDRFFDAIDLARSDMNIAIQWQTTTSNGVEAGVSRNYVKDIETIPGKIIFGWPISSELTKKAGTIKFAVRFYMIGDEIVQSDNGTNTTVPTLTYSFSTLPAEVKIQATLDYDLFSEAAMDMIDHGDLYVTRINNSIITDPSIPAPSAPMFLVNLGNDKTFTVQKDANGIYQWTEYKEAIPEHLLITDLGEDNTYTFEALAAPTGSGAITYDWKKTPYKADGALSSNTISLNPTLNDVYQPADFSQKVGATTKAAINATGSNPTEYYLKTTNSETGADQYEKINVDTFLTDEAFIIDGDGKVVKGEEKFEFYVKYTSSVDVNYAEYKPVALREGLGEDDVPTLDASHLYYTQYEDPITHRPVYTVYSGNPADPAFEYTVNDEGTGIIVNGTEIPLYERYTFAKVDDAGDYYVEAIAKAHLKEARTESAHVRIPAPGKPVIESPEEENSPFTGSKLEAGSINWSKDSDGNYTIHATLDNNGRIVLPVAAHSPETEEGKEDIYGANPKVSLSYQWYSNYSDPSIHIYDEENSAIADDYMISDSATFATMDDNGSLTVIPGVNKDDLEFYVKVGNKRNTRVQTKYSYKYRVTPAPLPPVLSYGGAVTDWQTDQVARAVRLYNSSTGAYNKLRVGVNKTREVDSVNVPVQHDNYFYIWMKMNVEEGIESDKNASGAAILQVDLGEKGAEFGFVDPTGSSDVVVSTDATLDDLIHYLETDLATLENVDGMPKYVIAGDGGATLDLGSFGETDSDRQGYFYCIVVNQLNNHIAVNVSQFFIVT